MFLSPVAMRYEESRDMPLLSSPCLLMENTILDRAPRYINLLCRAVSKTEQGTEGRKGGCILASHQCIPDKEEVSLAIVFTRPMNSIFPQGGQAAQLLSLMRAREAEGGWEKGGIVMSTLGKTPHHEFRHTVCPSAKSRTGLALLDTAAGLAAPCLLLY